MASTAPHSASERIARDIQSGVLSAVLAIVWRVARSKAEAKLVQDALIVLFTREFGRQPAYNEGIERCADPEQHQEAYASLKLLLAE